MRTRARDIESYVTKDGSLIRELMHPDAHGQGRMSLAKARIEPGRATTAHLHERAEEIYHVLGGRGRMNLGGQDFEIEPGDTVRISPGVAHSLVNTGREELVILCCCCPPYAHEDTELV